MRTPVLSFQSELLTDAPFELIQARLQDESTAGFRCLRRFKGWRPVVFDGEALCLVWEQRIWGASEQGRLCFRPDPKGAHLRLEGRMKGWTGFAAFAWLRWRADHLLERLVAEL
ncbi:MAG: hypothetical protein LWX11_02345 [Firmicutes bacterium]|nr:hypothetical protein [Bacillota bacterium]